MAWLSKQISRNFGDIFTADWHPNVTPTTLVRRSPSPTGPGTTFLGGRSYPQVVVQIDTSITPTPPVNFLQLVRFYWTVFFATPAPGTVPRVPPVGEDSSILWQQLMTPRVITVPQNPSEIIVIWDLGPDGLQTESQRRDTTSGNTPEFCSGLELIDYGRALWPTVHPGVSISITTMDLSVWGQHYP